MICVFSALPAFSQTKGNKKQGLCGVYLGDKDPHFDATDVKIKIIKEKKYTKEREIKGIAAWCYMGINYNTGKPIKVPNEDIYDEYKNTFIGKPFRKFGELDEVHYIASPIGGFIHTISVFERYKHIAYNSEREKCMSDDEIKTALDEFDIINSILEKHYNVKGTREEVYGFPKSYHLDDSANSKEKFTRITYKLNPKVSLFLEQIICHHKGPCYSGCKNRKNYANIDYGLTMIDNELHNRAKEERLQIEKAIQEIERESNDGTVGLD